MVIIDRFGYSEISYKIDIKTCHSVWGQKFGEVKKKTNMFPWLIEHRRIWCVLEIQWDLYPSFLKGPQKESI